MVPVGDEYKNLVSTNIRYPCKPTIVVGGVEENGNVIRIEFKASQIKELQFTYGIDPLSRELPYIELTWTEVLDGKLDENGNIFKYANVKEHMFVDLYFEQDLAPYNSWRLLYEENKTWLQLFYTKKTWKNLKKEVLKQTIRFPRVFLVDKPKAEGNTIKWTARDALYFCTLNQNFWVNFDLFSQEYKNKYIIPIRELLRREANTITDDNDQLKIYLNSTINFLMNNEKVNGIEHNGIISFYGKTSDLLRKYMSVSGNVFMSFPSPDRVMEAGYVSFDIAPSVDEFINTNGSLKKLYVNSMYKQPVLNRQSGVGSYQATIYNVVFGEKGDLPETSQERTHKAEKGSVYELTSNYCHLDTFVEDNDLQVNDNGVELRFAEIRRFIYPNSVIAECEILHDLSIEPSDFVEFETGVYKKGQNGDLEKVAYNGMVVKNSIKYNGAIRQSITINSVEY